jgi:hypothetical protein
MTTTGPHLHYCNEEEEGEESGRPVESEEDAEDVTSLNLFVCKNMGFQKLAMKLCAYETIKDVFLFLSLKS